MTYELKKRLRAAIREAGKAVGERERVRISKEVIRRVEDSPRFGTSNVVAAYAALPDEVSTIALLRRWSGAKRLVLPAIEGGLMVFREYTGEADLNSGAFGIREPRRGRIIPPEEIELMIVPGMAFDPVGRRLGRGKGFYDYYLSSPGAVRIHKMGVCLPHQLVDEVPHESHDVVMDDVITSSMTK